MNWKIANLGNEYKSGHESIFALNFNLKNIIIIILNT